MIPLPTVELDPPTISMTFGVNDSPLSGRDGTHVSNYYLPNFFHKTKLFLLLLFTSAVTHIFLINIHC